MDPSTEYVRPYLRRKVLPKNKKRQILCKLNGPFPGKFSTIQILEIRELAKTTSLHDLSVKYGRHISDIRNVVTGKYFSTCKKRNAQDRRIKNLFG